MYLLPPHSAEMYVQIGFYFGLGFAGAGALVAVVTSWLNGISADRRARANAQRGGLGPGGRVGLQ